MFHSGTSHMLYFLHFHSFVFRCKSAQVHHSLLWKMQKGLVEPFFNYSAPHIVTSEKALRSHPPTSLHTVVGKLKCYLIFFHPVLLLSSVLLIHTLPRLQSYCTLSPPWDVVPLNLQKNKKNIWEAMMRLALREHFFSVPSDDRSPGLALNLAFKSVSFKMSPLR